MGYSSFFSRQSGIDACVAVTSPFYEQLETESVLCELKHFSKIVFAKKTDYKINFNKVLLPRMC